METPWCYPRPKLPLLECHQTNLPPGNRTKEMRIVLDDWYEIPQISEYLQFLAENAYDGRHLGRYERQPLHPNSIVPTRRREDLLRSDEDKPSRFLWH